MVLFAYFSVTCRAAGTNPSSALGQTGARSVVTSTGAVAQRSARAKNARAASAFAAGRDQYVDPAAGDFDVGFVDQPPVTGRVPGRSGRVDELRCEGLHPPVDRHVIHGDAALGQQFLHVAVGQAVPAARSRADQPAAQRYDSGVAVVMCWPRSG